MEVAEEEEEEQIEEPHLFTYDQLLETPFMSATDKLEEIEKKHADEEIWDTIKTSMILPIETLKLIYEYSKDGEWLIFDKTGDVKEYIDTLSVNGECMYNTGIKLPQAIFLDGVDTYWPCYQAGKKDAWITWNFNKIVSIYQFKVRAEEYSDFGHFAKEILLFAGMDPTHKSYKYGIKLHTKQCGGWQYFYDIDLINDQENEPFVVSGRYWRLIMNKTHQENRYAEIAQIDMKGFVCK